VFAKGLALTQSLPDYQITKKVLSSFGRCFTEARSIASGLRDVNKDRVARVSVYKFAPGQDWRLGISVET
jgi:hypothetical protein